MTDRAAFMPCVMCLSPITCEDIGCDRKPKSAAFERGRTDGANYLRRFRAEEQGILIKDRYASNPYHDSDPLWREYNKGFNDGCEYQIYIG